MGLATHQPSPPTHTMGVPVALAIVVGLLSSFVQSLGEFEAARPNPN